jgi:hypothetical protein
MFGRCGWRRRLSGVGLVVAGVAWSSAARAAPSLQLGELQAVDPSPRKLPASASRSTIASDGSGWLAVYSDSGWLTATRIQASGLPSGDGFAVGPSDFSANDPHVAFDGTDFVVAFQTNGIARGIGMQRVTSSGLGTIVDLKLQGDWAGIDLAIDDGIPRVLACEATYLKSVCSTVEVAGDEATTRPSFELPFPVDRVHWAFAGGTGFAIVETGAHAVALLEVSTEGQLLAWRILENNDVTGDYAFPTIVATADGYAAAWHRTDGIRVVALSPEGELTAEQIVSGDGSLSRPVLAPTTDAWLLLSSNESALCNYCVNLYAQSLSPQLDDSPGDEVLLAGDAFDAAVAATGASTTLVVFPSPDALNATLVDAAQPAPQPQRVPIAFTAAPQGFPTTATAPGGWLVAWAEEETLRSALVDFGGVARPFPLGLPDSASGPIAVEEGEDGWLMVWAGTDVKVTRLNYQGEAGIESYTLDNPQRVRVARASGGWVVAWSRFFNFGQSVLTLERFDFGGAHQSSTELAQWIPNVGTGAYYAIPFDIAATANGFRVVWSAPSKGISSLELDSTGQPQGTPKTLYPWETDGLNLAVTPQAAWLAYSNGSSNYFAPLPLTPELNTSANEYLMELRAVGGAAVLAWADRYGGFVGSLALASPSGRPKMSDVTFPTYATPYGFAFSKAQGNRALLVTQETERPFGIPQSRLHAGVVTVNENLGDAGGAAGDAGGAAGDAGGAADGGVGGSDFGLGGSDNGLGGSHDMTTAGAGGDASDASDASEASEAGAPTEVSDMGGAPLETSAPKPNLESGCGCKLGAQHQSTGPVSWLLLLAASLAARRRPQGARRKRND